MSVDDVASEPVNPSQGAAKYWFGSIGFMPAVFFQYLYWPFFEPGSVPHLVAWGVSAFFVMRWSIRLGRYVDKLAFEEPTKLRTAAVGIGAHFAFLLFVWLCTMMVYSFGTAFRHTA